MYIIVKFKPDQLNIYLRRLQQNKLDQQNSFVVIYIIYKTYQRLIELILYIIISIFFCLLLLSLLSSVRLYLSKY